MDADLDDLFLPSASTTTLFLSIATSVALAALALLIQSDSPLLHSIRCFVPNSRSTIPSSQPSSPSPSKKPKPAKQPKRKANNNPKPKEPAVVDTSASLRRKDGGSTTVSSPQPNSSRARPKPSPSTATIATPRSNPSKKSSHKKQASLPPPTRPAGPQPKRSESQRARGLSCSNIFHSFLNPRAAVYEFRAQYTDLPQDPLTTSNVPKLTPSPQPSPPDPAQASVQHPAAAITDGPLADPSIRQSYDAFLVLDVEATCAPGSTFDYPNEIIEWPVVLMRWVDKDEVTGRAAELVVVDEFRSYVRPTWRPKLTDFCTSLTGITQPDIDSAPTFPEMLASFELWLQKHNLIPPPTALLTPPSSRCSSPSLSNSNLADAPPSPSHEDHPAPLLLVTPNGVDARTTSIRDGHPLPPPSESNSTSPSDPAMFSPAMSTSSLSSPPSFAFSPLASHRTSLTSFAGLPPHTFVPPVERSEGTTCGDSEADWDAYGTGSTYTSRFAWATDGPFDLRDFLVKQCFISRMAIPEYFLGDIIDVRKVVGSWVDHGGDRKALSILNSTPQSPLLSKPPSPLSSIPSTRPSFHRGHAKKQSLNIPLQLQALSLGSFSGQQHRGIDDARNICRIMQALASRGVRLEANMYVNPNRRWFWMGQDGRVVVPPSSTIQPSS
ncbi:hypothetical protein FRB99_006045 [Tulasnella sp. 403]|nr:hypothetical protein FRB99_006045 [Tulasnella sp. 403]